MKSREGCFRSAPDNKCVVVQGQTWNKTWKNLANKAESHRNDNGDLVYRYKSDTDEQERNQKRIVIVLTTKIRYNK